MVNKVLAFMKTRMFRYIIAGGTSFVVEYGSFLMLYYGGHLSAVMANTISFILSLITSFSLNKLWVFKSEQQDRHVAHQLVLYACVAAFNVVMTDIIIHWLVGVRVPAFAAKMLLIILVAIWNFFVFQKLIFKTQK